MTLRSKTIILVAAALIALIAAVYISSRAVLLYSFAQLEQEASQKDVQRALNVLDSQLLELDTTADDWAAWDDTYAFMLTRDPRYVESNLLDDTFVTLRLNALLLVDQSGQIVFGRAFDLQDEEEIPLPQSLLGHLTTEGLLSPTGEPGSYARGILQLPDGPILASSRPVLTSTEEGPPRGWLIMARYLDSTEVERLGHITDSTLTIEPFDNPTGSADLEAVRSALLKTPSSIVVRPVSGETVAGYAVIPDIYGAPGLLVEVETPREIYHRGQVAVTYILTATVLVGLAFGALQSVMLDRQVLTRVIELGAGVARIRSRDDLSARLQVDGQDELSRLGTQINEMLERIQNTQANLQRSEERFRSMADNIRDGLTIIEDGRPVYVNDRACEIFGYPRDELMKIQDLDLMASDDKERLESVVQEARQSGQMPGELEFWAVRKDGTHRYVSNRYASSPDPQLATQSYVVTTDITGRKREQDSIRRLAFHDPLTGLPNRTLFNDRIDVALARARRDGERLALLLLDLDHFKKVNDRLGHTVGDQLLQAVGERLTTLLRETDTVCRMGGDEFLILITGITAPDAGTKVALRVLKSIRRPFVIDGHQLRITTSLGIAIYPDDAEDVDTLIRQTDYAMYLAKERGRNNCQRYDSSGLKSHHSNRRAMEG
jgi:diguanylate cyclase (GGDEF)-like protein/PAS domain S-box-containing protein